ncbi:ABC transporter permease [Streptomyces hainanensis]|uniref:ABC transporter permease n=1 Tax=Streptomyces hainanensis TaxID=402648 RepID=A0A4R4TAS4_9ACTN|nr:ABC transporter permease [Streptomyces hainanensis]
MPTVVIGLATLVAVASAVLAGTLLAAARGPFDDAFARQHGAHLTLGFDAGAVTADELAAAAAAAVAADVTEWAGPFPTATIAPVVERAPGSPVNMTGAGRPGPPLTVVGRAEPTGAVDDLALTDGRWAAGPGEIVVSADGPLGGLLGARIGVPELPGEPTLDVVGVARSVTRTADAWVTPRQLADLLPADEAGGFQLLYRLAAADTEERIAAARAEVTAGDVANAVTGATSWLAVRETVERETALFVPFVVAFGVLGLAMSVLVVGNVVAGAVGTGLRRIGILKSVGLTPTQVVWAHALQALLPAAVGAGLGVGAGHLLAVPVLAEAESAFVTAGLTVALRVDVGVVFGVLGVVTATAVACAWRAGRLRTMDALALGRVPAAARGRRAARLIERLRLGRPLGLGLARPFARPARALAMGAAVVFGTTAVTFTVGLAASLVEVTSARNHDEADVIVDLLRRPLGGPGAPEGPSAPDAVGGEEGEEGEEGADAGSGDRPDPGAVAAEVAAAIEATDGTRAWYATAPGTLTVPGLSGEVAVNAFTGDASWGGYRMISGRWFAGPGEAVVPTPFLTITGTRVGDTVTLDGGAGSVTLRIVGEVFDPRYDGRQLFTDTASVATALPDLTPLTYHVAVEPGTDPDRYAAELNEPLGPLDVTATTGGLGDGGSQIAALNALAGLLTLLLVVVAALGVLNGVVLDTRERARELGIHRALGMTPAATVAMVVTGVLLPGLVGGALGVPLGVALHDLVLPAMGDAAGLVLPDSITDVYAVPALLALGVGGPLIAVLGALLPAGWAARVRTATALRAE